MALYIVRCGFDREADVWIVEQSDVPGLATEAPSFDELCRKINVMAPELLGYGDSAFNSRNPDEMHPSQTTHHHPSGQPAPLAAPAFGVGGVRPLHGNMKKIQSVSGKGSDPLLHPPCGIAPVDLSLRQQNAQGPLKFSSASHPGPLPI